MMNEPLSLSSDIFSPKVIGLFQHDDTSLIELKPYHHVNYADDPSYTPKPKEYIRTTISLTERETFLSTFSQLESLFLRNGVGVLIWLQEANIYSVPPKTIV